MGRATSEIGSQGTTSTAPLRRTAITTVGLLMGIYIIDYVDRAMIAIALPAIGADFDLSKTEQGLVISAFALSYMVSQIPGGYLAGRFGARPMLLVSLVLWSMFTALSGLVWGLAAFIVVRVLFGVSQALFPAAATKALAERTTPRTRGSAAGLMLSSNFMGAGLGPLIVAPVLLAFGWRHTFWMVAVGGVLIAVVLWRALPNPIPVHLANESSETQSAEASGVVVPLRVVLRNAVVWKFAGLLCATNMITFGMMTWIPSYLIEVRGISLIRAGISSAIPFLTMSAALVVGGLLFDRYFFRRAHMLIIPSSLVCALLLLLMIRAETAFQFTVFQSLAMGAAGIAFMAVLGMPFRALPTGAMAAGISVINTGGQLAGFIAPLVMGILADMVSYTAAFGFLVFASIMAAAIACFVPRRPSDFKFSTAIE